MQHPTAPNSCAQRTNHPAGTALQFATATGERETVPLERVESVRFQRAGFFPGVAELDLQGAAAGRVLSFFASREPSHITGAPLALRTGDLSIRYSDAHGAEHERRFELLADHLLKDHDHPAVIYSVDDTLRQVLLGVEVSDQ